VSWREGLYALFWQFVTIFWILLLLDIKCRKIIPTIYNNSNNNNYIQLNSLVLNAKSIAALANYRVQYDHTRSKREYIHVRQINIYIVDAGQHTSVITLNVAKYGTYRLTKLNKF
jgi:hypothetical protein